MHLDAVSVAVIGGGIAGLTVATALARAGADVRLFEQAEAIAEVGAGIQITPNGTAVLAALGLGERVLTKGIRAEGVTLCNYVDGAEVLALDFSRRRHTNPHPYIFLHRADLIATLADAAAEAGVEIETGRKALPPGAEGGDAVEADLVIGADGLHSAARQVLNGKEVPFFTGQVAWRALVPLGANEVPAPVARVHMGPGRHLVTYPLRGGRLMNVVAVEERRSWVAEGWSHPDDPTALREAFAEFGGPVPDLLSRVEEVFVWGLFRHRVAPRWHDGKRLVILGDAVHPTLPFLAQGANMALEDAWVLAHALESADSLGAALAGYQAARQARVTRIVDAATRNARAYHLRHPLGRRLAHLALRAGGTIMPSAALSRFDWLYGKDVTRA